MMTSDDLDNIEINSNATNTSYTSSDLSSSIFLNDLTSVEKMSLKLKIFDLQKKLHLLEIEKEIIEEYPFKPELHSSYHIKDRDRNFLDNLEKNNQIREHRMQQLKEQVRQDEGYTFKPKITPRAKKLYQATSSSSLALEGGANDDVNVSINGSLDGAGSESSSMVFQRLFDRAQEKHKRLQQKINYSLKFDVKTGKKLFTPELNSISQKYFDGLEETMTTDEYLYREAMDRIATKREAEIRARQDVKELANKKKVIDRSVVYLKHRLERELRGVFEFMLSFATENTKSNTPSVSASAAMTTSSVFESSICFGDVEAIVELFVRKAIFPANKLYYVTETIFDFLNVNKNGTVTLKTFLKVAYSMVTSTTSTYHPEIKSEIVHAHNTKNISNDISSGNDDDSDNDHDIEFTIDDSSASEEIIDYNSLSYSTSTRDGATPSLPGQQQEYISKYVQTQRVALFKKFLNCLLSLHRSHVLAGTKMDVTAPTTFTHQPKINSKSETLAKKKVEIDKKKLQEYNISYNSSSLENVDLMYLRSKIKDEKIILQQRQKEIVEQSKCTFQPKINTIVSSSDEAVRIAPTTPVFQRLFEKSVEKIARDKGIMKNKEGVLSPKDIDDNRECTFKPSINKEVASVKKTDVFSIKGVAENVNRVRKIRSEHFAEAEEEAKKSSKEYIDDKYAKGRQKLLQTGPQAPKLSNGGGRVGSASKDKPHKVPRLNIDIKLGPNKVVSLSIYNGEDPADVADRFCKVYGLAGDALEIIRRVVEDNLNEVASRGGSCSPRSPVRKPSLTIEESTARSNFTDVNKTLSAISNISRKLS